MSGERITINRLTWARWGRAIRIFASSEVGGRAMALAALLVLLLVTINGLNVAGSYVGRDFMTAIEQQNMPRFLRYAGLYVCVFALLTVTAVIYRFIEERLGLLWREWLSRRLSGVYLQDLNYYALKDRRMVDNPDQRIADDVRAFTATTLSFALMLLNGTFTILAFSGVLWSISPLLFGVAVGYATLGSALTVFLGRRLMWLSYRQSDREAAFRAELVHVRENAETLAISRRESRLVERLGLRIDELTANARKMIAVNRNLGFFTTGYNYLIQILPALIVAPLFIRGQAEFGVIPQSAMAFTHLLGAFSIIVTQFQSISSFAATVARLSVLAEAMEGTAPGVASGIEIVEPTIGADARAARAEVSVRYEGLTLRSPRRGRTLVDALDVTIPGGLRVLVSSADELASVALFRASAGIWNFGTGRIFRPPLGELLFVPERPYLPPGTLRHLLVRTAAQGVPSDTELGAALDRVGVQALIARSGGLDIDQDWDNALSLREQQLVEVASVLLARPRFAFLDRITTTLNPADSERALAALTEKGMTVVLFGAAPPEAQCDATLGIAADGTWEWRTCAQGRASG